MAEELHQAVADAVAAFDAANMAWGQFYLHTWRVRGGAARAQAQALRQAFGDAALYVPDLPTAEGIRGFVAALETVRAELQRFIATAGTDSVPGDVRDLDALLDEAAGSLRPFLESERGSRE